MLTISDTGAQAPVRVVVSVNVMVPDAVSEVLGI